MDCQDATRASKPVIGTAIVHAADPILLEGRGTHDARLYCHVEIGGLEKRLGMNLEELGDC